jgi:DNA polymerase I-like protein with 3'-5' exonuclease and polymerase domains
MLGEHYIDEDKKGFYSLKQLTPLYASSYEGYDDELQDLLRGEEEQDADDDDGDGDDNNDEAPRELHLTDDEVLDRELVLGCPPDRDETQWQALVAAIKKYQEIRETPAKKRSTHEQDQFKDKKKEISELRKELSVKVPRKKKDAEKTDKGDGDGGFEKIPLETILVYAAVDADVTRLILRAQTNRLHRTDSWDDARDVMRYLYVPASYTLSNMEYRGFKMNLEYLEELNTALTEQMNAAKEVIASQFDPNLNLNAPQQVLAYMSRLQFDSIPGEDTASTNKDLLGKYEEMYEPGDPRNVFVTQLLAYREAHKALSTYIKPYRRLTKADGRIHCRFHLNGTATGRLSSADPNLQNVPLIVCFREAGDEVVNPGFNLKRLFVPSRPDYIIVDCDIKGAELRVYTAYSRDKSMIDALNQGMDVHSLVTSKAYKMPYEEVQARKDEPDIDNKRTNCKRTVFGTFYGAGPYKIAQQINSTKEYAEWLQNFLFTEFPELRAYVSEVEHEVRSNREVKTFFGRRRRFQLAHVSRKLMNDALREAVNFKIQSTSSDLVVSQLIEMDQHFAELEAEMLITVHDSMVFEMPERNLHKLKPFLDHWIVNRVKEKFAWLPVPFLYDVKVGATYGDVVKLEKYNAQKAAG